MRESIDARGVTESASTQGHTALCALIKSLKDRGATNEQVLDKQDSK